MTIADPRTSGVPRPRADHPGALTRLCAAQAFSQLGDQVSRIAIAAVLWSGEAAPARELLVLLAIAAVPSILIGLAAGAVADRHPGRWLLVASDLGRAALVLAFPLLASIFDSPRPIYALLPLVLGLNRAFRVARGRLMPEWVPRARLARANAWLLGVDRGAEVVGAAVAGGLVVWLGWKLAFVVDAATYLASAAIVLGLPAVTASASSGAASGASAPAAPGVGSRWRDLLEEARARADLAVVALSPAIAGFLAGVLVPIVLDELPRIHGAQAPAVAGWIMSALAAGAIVGAVVSGRPAAARTGGPLRLVLAAAIACVVTGSLTFDAARPVLVALAALAGIAAATVLIGSETTLQRQASPGVLGRWLAVRETGERAAFLIGLALASAASFTDLAPESVRAIAAVLGGIACAAGIAVVIGEWRRRGELGPRAILLLGRLLRPPLRVMSLDRALAIAERIGRRTTVLHPGAARSLRENQRAWGIQAPLAHVLGSYARTHVETAAIDAGRLDELVSRTAIDGWEHVDAARDADRPIVIVTAHVGNWDLLGAVGVRRWSERGSGPRLVVFAERIRPPELFEHYVELRRRAGIPIVTGRAGARSALRTLRERGAVAMAADRARDGATVEVSGSWGVNRVPIGPYRLAIDTGAVVLPMVVLRTPNGYGLRVSPPIPRPPASARADRDAAIALMATTFAGELHRWLQEVPEQWLVLGREAR